LLAAGGGRHGVIRELHSSAAASRLAEALEPIGRCEQAVERSSEFLRVVRPHEHSCLAIDDEICEPVDRSRDDRTSSPHGLERDIWECFPPGRYAYDRRP
jgi:hypothetical protein